MAFFMNNICRLCMSRKDSLIPLFSNDNRNQTMSLPDKIMNFVPVIKVFVGDGLPSQVCESCVRLVNTSYKFKVQCETSDSALRQYLINHPLQDNSGDILHSIFRSDNSGDCWKLDGVKNEVVEVSVTPDTDLEDSGADRLDDISEQDDGWSGDLQEDCENVKDKSINAQQQNSSEKKTGFEKSKNSTFVGSTNSKTIIKKSESRTPAPSAKGESNSDSNALPSSSVAKSASESKVGSRTKVSKKNSNISCTQCGKTFTQKHHLVMHMATHTGEKPYDCPQCDKKFARRRQLTVHMFTHTGEKPFLCPICGDCFGRSDTLTKHMRSHTGEKPFHCAVCGNNFGRRSTLTNHMRAHMGEKPYLCTECGWRFVQSYDLTKHMRSHTGEKPFQCTVCRMSFGQRNSLTKHMRSHTAEASTFSVDITKGLQYGSYTSPTFNMKKGQSGKDIIFQSEKILENILPSDNKKDSHCASQGLHIPMTGKESGVRDWRDGYEMLGGTQRWLN